MADKTPKTDPADEQIAAFRIQLAQLEASLENPMPDPSIRIAAGDVARALVRALDAKAAAE